MTLRLSLIVALLLATSIEAQDIVSWTRYYDINHGEDSFGDIYASQDGNYVTCGMSGERLWINKLSRDGETLWSHFYDGGRARIACPWTMIESDEGNFLVGMERNGNFSALLVTAEGNQIWWRDYGDGICHSLIELKSGEFLMLGHKDAAYRLGRMIMVDAEGDVVWDRTYDPGGFCDLYFMRETEGGVIVTGTASPHEGQERPHLWLIKMDLNGDIIWDQHHRIGESIGRSIAADRHGGFVITGQLQPNRGSLRAFLMNVNNLGEQQWLTTFEPENEDCIEEGWSVLAPERGGFAVVGGSFDYTNRVCKPKIIYAGANGMEVWSKTYEMPNSRVNNGIKFFSVIKGHDRSIIAAGMIDNTEDSTRYDGFITKLIEENVAPRIYFWEPQEDTLIILPDTSYTFLVRADDPQNDALTYTWMLNQTAVSNDTTVSMFFAELGEQRVRCEVSDGENVTSRSWAVFVDDLFITDYSPDSLNLIVRRSTSVDFSIDEVKFSEGNDPAYEWTFTDLADSQRYDLGPDSFKTVDFPFTGDYTVEGRAYRRQATDSVIWTIMSRGAIFSYGPMGDTLVVGFDSLITFGIVLTNPQNHDYYVRWRVNGDLVLQHATEMVWRFRTEEDVVNRVRVIVSDRLETDTLAWYIKVRSLGVEDRSPVVEDFGMLAVSPNPFNSKVTLSFSVRQASLPVHLTIHDIAGRELSRLVDGEVSAGSHEVVFDGTTLPAGIYFARLEAGGEVGTVKMVLLR